MSLAYLSTALPLITFLSISLFIRQEIVQFNPDKLQAGAYNLAFHPHLTYPLVVVRELPV